MDVASALMEPEEGEISDSEYTPLPRPATLQASSSSSLAISNASRLAPPPLSSDDDASSASSADSDDSGPRPAKSRRPRRPPVTAPPRPPAVPAKYKVWSQDVQEDALNEQLVNCDVVHKYDRSRDVESYDYNLLRPKFDAERTSPVDMEEAEPEQEQPITNKRRHKERGNVKQRLGRRVVDPIPQDFTRDDDGRSPSPRFLLDLHPNPDPTPEEATLDIANKLCEEKEDLVRKVVEVLGVARAIRLYNKTKDIEADGGMMILNGARRRTPGGVFFYLLRNEADITRAQHDAIFSEDLGAHAAHKRAANKRKRAANVDRLRAAEEARLQRERDAALLPALLDRAEGCVQQLAQESERGEGEEEGEVVEQEEQEEGEVEEEEAEVSNPPPSPATDPRDNVGGGNGPRKVTSYDEDDFLEVGVNDDEMEMF